jgi:S1-C subfamily serine protease
MMAALAACALVLAFARPSLAADDAPKAADQRPLTIDDFSVVELRATAMRDARSARTLGSSRQGSGIVIDSSGLILTIGYLINETENIEVIATDRRPVTASVIGYDSTTGFGLLRAATPLQVKPIEFGTSDKIGDKEPVLIVGYDGAAPALVVSRRPFVGSWEYLLDEAIFTAPATTGWSGAALINREGKLVGVGSLAVADALGSERYLPGNMFVPIDLLKPILGELIANGKPASRPRPWIGINTQDVQGKVVVTRVSPESPAEAGGVHAGDIILGIRGQALVGQADFYRKLWASGEAGAEIVLDIIQGTEVRKVKLQTADRDSYFRARPIY